MTVSAPRTKASQTHLVVRLDDFQRPLRGSAYLIDDTPPSARVIALTSLFRQSVTLGLRTDVCLRGDLFTPTKWSIGCTKIREV